MRTLSIILFFIFVSQTTASEQLIQKLETTKGFITNDGQWDQEALFLYRNSSMDIWITDNSILIDAYRFIEEKPDNIYDVSLVHNYYREGQRINFRFLNSRTPKIAAESVNRSYYNYIIGGNDRSYAYVPSYKAINLIGLYDGVDLEYYTESGNLRYDIIFSPGTKPSDIEIGVTGSENIRLEKGNLIIETKFGEIIQTGLYAYQVNNGQEERIDCSFHINNDSKISFKVKDYDQSLPIIIDPLVYSTFTGGNEFDYGKEIEIDDEGYIYVCGSTASSDFPVTVGAYSEKLKKSGYSYPDIFLTKIDSNRKDIIFSTFIGSYVDDIPEGLSVDSNGDIFIAGYVGETTTFPVTEFAYDTLNNGGYDIFAVKLKNDGSELLYSTLMGSNKDDYAIGIDIDKQNFLYITGYSAEGGIFPVSGNAFQRSYSGKFDAFVSVLSPDLSSLGKSTLIGGGHNDFGQAVKVAPDGRVYITGITRSSDFPVSVGAFDTSFNDTSDTRDFNDCFISVFDKNLDSLICSSFFGGAAKDAAYDLEIDSLRNIFITGFTESSDFPVTNMAFDTTYNSYGTNNGVGDVFVSKFDSVLSRLVLSTYYGGSGTDRGYSLAVDINSNAYVTGITSSDDLPPSRNPFDATYNDSSLKFDAFLLKLSSNGRGILYSSYLGGSKEDIGKALILGLQGKVYILGTTVSPDFPVTVDATDTTYNDSLKSDAFLACIALEQFYVDAGRDLSVCLGRGARLNGIASGDPPLTYKWEPSNGLSSDIIPDPIVMPDSTTEYILTVTDGGGNTKQDSIIITVLPSHNAKIYGSVKCRKFNRYMYADAAVSGLEYRWSVEGGIIVSGFNTSLIEVVWNDSISEGFINLYEYNDHDCSDTARLRVEIGIDSHPGIVPIGPLDFCENTSTELDVGGDFTSYLWSDGKTTRRNKVLYPGDYWVAVTDSSGSLFISDTLTLTWLPIPEKPEIDYTNDTLYCRLDAFAYQWYYEGKEINGASAQTYRPTKLGDYFVCIYNELGCMNCSDYKRVIIGDVPEIEDSKISIYPNPADEVINIEFNLLGKMQIELIDLLGNPILKHERISNGKGIHELHINGLAPGMYYIRVSNYKQNFVQKIIINK